MWLSYSNSFVHPYSFRACYYFTFSYFSLTASIKCIVLTVVRNLPVLFQLIPSSLQLQGMLLFHFFYFRLTASVKCTFLTVMKNLSTLFQLIPSSHHCTTGYNNPLPQLFQFDCYNKVCCLLTRFPLFQTSFSFCSVASLNKKLNVLHKTATCYPKIWVEIIFPFDMEFCKLSFSIKKQLFFSSKNGVNILEVAMMD